MLTFVLGGARSGKSRHAVELCRDASRVVFIATAKAEDDEMAERIARHRAERPASWTTVEAPVDLEAALEAAPSDARVLVDCVTLWLSNLMYEHRDEVRAERERLILGSVTRLADRAADRDVVVVSNEVGQSLVPETAVGREFRDLLGAANQTLAAKADRVILLLAGIPIDLFDHRQ